MERLGARARREFSRRRGQGSADALLRSRRASLANLRHRLTIAGYLLPELLGDGVVGVAAEVRGRLCFRELRVLDDGVA
ncbi:hypothetical protein D3C73_843940 [compost metagenome]